MTQLIHYPLIQAKNYTIASRTKIDLIVIHTMEAPDKPGTARAVARWFASSGAPAASCHYCVDNQTIVQCVRDQDIAWHAPGANRQGIGIEHAGFARQTPEQWASEANEAMLTLSARLVARLCERWLIPVRWLDAQELAAGERGITGHKQVTDAFCHGRGHWDPGPNFPVAHYLDLIRRELGVS